MCELPPGLDGNWLRKNYLFGVVLTNDQGRPYPEELYTNQIAAAVELLETELGIVIRPTVITDDAYDVSLTHSPRFQVRLVHRPVRRVTRWVFQRGQADPIEIDVDLYVRLRGQARHGGRGSETGEVELDLMGARIPGVWDGRWFPSYSTFRHGAAQALVKIDYLAGFDGDVFPLSAGMKDWIGMKAATLPLDTAGDLIAGAGIASKSIGQDGLSQSLGTTSSATNAGYGARILSYGKRLPGILDTLKAKYTGVRGFAGI